MRACSAGMLAAHAGRVEQVGLMMSRTTRAVVFASRVTVAGAGMAGATLGASVGDAVGDGGTVGAAVVGAAVVSATVGLGDGAAAGVVHEARRAIAVIAGMARRITLSIRVPYLKRRSSRFRTMVSSNAGRPSFRITSMARFNAGPTSFGSSIGPSLYQPNDRASIAKSGAGSERSMPMFAFDLSVPRLSATRSWCSQSL